ncbi:MAG TPA: hypothetical protein VD814_04900, partial [Nocardioides sp.]|nr:hypothetical protein [Nocardioides sp.]
MIQQAGPPRPWAAGLVLSGVLLLVGVGWAVWPEDPYVARPPSAPGTTEVRPGEAAAVLERLEQAVADADPAAAGALAPAGSSEAAALLRAVVRNARTIGVDDFTLRYVDALGGADEQGRWSATVDTRWRFAGFDAEAAAAEVEFTLDAGAEGTSIAAVTGPRGHSPVWLSGPVDVRKDARTLVVAADGAGRYFRTARAAVPRVSRALPSWRQGLVVEVPDSAAALDAALGAEAGQYAAIAAVTSGVGEESGPRSPVHVLVNPDVYDELEPLGAQVVMTHEVVHVAAQAATEPESVPAWLTEGYADYVALRDVRLPLSVTAAQVIEQVRRQGPPARLP